MFYLTRPAEIQAAIAQFAAHPILWIDTEVADWYSPVPRLSLIQVLAQETDCTGEFAYILDVLEKRELVQEFIGKIMANPDIEKVFHNASYDLRFLGKSQSQNVTCTLKWARTLKRDRLGVSNFKLKTLAAELCQFSDIHPEEQSSDWGQRPLSQGQLRYAKMDPVYLAQVYLKLKQFTKPQPFPIPKLVPMPKSESSDPKSLTATNVRVAFECPRLFYLGQHFGKMTMFIPTPNAFGIGNPFHELAKQFVSLILDGPEFTAFLADAPPKLNANTLAQQMQTRFYDLRFRCYLQSTIQADPNKLPALNQIWQGLKGLIQRYAELLVTNRQFYSADSVLAKTFIAREFSLNYQFDLPDGSRQLVKGQVDNLIVHGQGDRLCAVEYKTYQPADISGQLAQVALYSYMLKQQRNCPVDSAVYCVLPEFKEYHYSWEELEQTVHQLIPYKLQQMQDWLRWQPPHPNPPPPTPQAHLCDICPQHQKCQTFFQSSPVAVDSPGNTPPPALKPLLNLPQNSVPKLPLNADAMGQQLTVTLKSFKINVDYLGAAIGPAFIRVKLKPAPGIKVASILKLSADLQVQLGIPVPPLIAPQAGYVSVDLPRGDRETAEFSHYIHRQQNPADAPVKIAIGIDLDGNLIEADLSDPNTCHFLVGGTTGSGKSEFLRSLLLSLLHRNQPSHLKIALVDPKRVTFPEFEGMRWLLSPIVKESEQAIALMAELVSDMETRYRQFESAGCNDITSYNRKAQNPLPRIVCIFDEYADFMAEKQIRADLELSIKRLGAMARAAGIHLIIATQRPEAKVVTPIIRSNLPGRVALRTASEADSSIILGGQETSAAYLLGKGDLLYQIGSQLHRLQSLFASKIDLS
ncbi:DNA translocase FtsK [Laspinema olomoucense]|uniref:FtsK/SpoIIIE domain-containing protein n=1 Tax=Laspinema olomoucense D3b TaxID=2953688 RepID=A0ABT2NA81_9CYAN|nr:MULTISPECIES: DNA translocase FtsK [unclassified Laspinema]MCT7971405.1 FtsK/SpoIIIE domain-containing protein [Laspinema sp. D3d]MCT7979472.1 FtsK/SpoIIIE domain-containing protein [Laspinema sp. D3b]MCT7987276.1 FtsK/SpoIIIE domain-containing protein [Laspinema sp. D3a]